LHNRPAMISWMPFSLPSICVLLVTLSQAPLLHPDSPEMNAMAPAAFQVKLETTRGDVMIEIRRTWSPRGVDRFFNLVKAGYYDDVRITRVVAPKWAQFGINGDPKIAKIWRDRPLPDDQRVLSNERGTLAFAFAVPNGRTTQVFINLRDNHETHDQEPFVPFGRVISVSDVRRSFSNRAAHSRRNSQSPNT